MAKKKNYRINDDGDRVDLPDSNTIDDSELFRLQELLKLESQTIMTLIHSREALLSQFGMTPPKSAGVVIEKAIFNSFLSLRQMTNDIVKSLSKKKW